MDLDISSAWGVVWRGEEREKVAAGLPVYHDISRGGEGSLVYDQRDVSKIRHIERAL